MTSVGSILAGAFGLVRRHPLSVLIWGLLYATAMIGLMFAMRPILQVYSELLSQQLAAGAEAPLDPQALQPFMARIQAAGGIMFLAEIAVFAFIMVLFTATQRAVLRPAEGGFAFLRLGGDELRLIALGMFLTICIYIGMFLAMLAMMIVVGIVAVASGSAVAIALVVLAEFVVLMGAMIYVQVRISLAFPLTFLRRDFVVREAWRLTGGRFWTLFGAYVIIGLVYSALAGVLFGFAAAPFFSELAQGANTPEAAQLALQHQIERFVTIDAYSVGLGLGATLLMGLTIALFGGAIATAARDLVPDAQSEAAPFA